MRKGLRRILCLLLCLASILLFVGVCAAESADYEAKLVVEFDQSGYLPGETATLTVSITGLEDEAAESLKLGAFETHIGFDSGKMQFMSESSFDSVLAEKLNGATQELMVAEEASRKDVAVILFDVQNGIPFHELNIQDGKLKIADLKFTVNAAAEGTISAGFEESGISGSYDYVSALMLLKDGSAEDKLVTCTVGEKAAASVLDTAMFAGSAVYHNTTNQVTAGVSVKKKADSADAVLIAALYDKITGAMESRAVVKAVMGNEVSFSDIVFEPISDAGNLEVRFFLWNNIGKMVSIAPVCTAEVR